MNSRSLGATRVFAWPDATVAVMGAVAAVRILHRRKLAEVEPEDRDQVEAELAVDHERLAGGLAKAEEIGVIDEVVNPSQTRTALARAFAEAMPPGRPPVRGHHTNIPL
jgi:acetyl-CoA/propionyl-CoA carboxylase carboxyl transferase subunit